MYISGSKSFDAVNTKQTSPCLFCAEHVLISPGACLHHTVPKPWFDEQTQMRVDLAGHHHTFLTQKR